MIGSAMIKDYIDSRFDIKYLNDFDFIIALGVCARNIASDICINPLLDMQTKRYIRYEAGTEEGVAGLFLHDFYVSQNDLNRGTSSDLASDMDYLKLKDYIKALDYGYLTSETNISEEEMQEIKRHFSSHKKPLLLIGSNFYLHKRGKNILDIFSILTESMNIAFLSICGDEIYTIKGRGRFCIEQIGNLPENNGCMVYVDTALSMQKPLLRFSKEFAKAWNIDDGSSIEISFDDSKINAQSFLDTNLSGVIGILSLDKGIDCGYRYKKVVINKVAHGKDND